MRWILVFSGALLSCALVGMWGKLSEINEHNFNWFVGTIFVVFTMAEALFHLASIAESLRKIASKGEKE